MSYNPNFYNNFHGTNSTFQCLPSNYVPPPPAPPQFFIPPAIPTCNREQADQDFLKTFEHKIPVRQLTEVNIKPLSISEVRAEICKMLLAVNELKDKQKVLTENMNTLSDEEWSSHMKQIEENKALITKTLSLVNGPYLHMLQKLLAKRSAKRLRLKRQRGERKREKDEWMKELKERSRKIDENLQKIQDEINKVKQEAEKKLQADMVLKEVLRKKSDAKKCLIKLDAFLKLRKARQNTVTGRGETVSESEAAAFNSNIEKLKTLWTQKLLLYEKEEVELRAQLEAASEVTTRQTETEREVAANLEKWRECLFNGQLPQVDFRGDVARFVAVRSQWDRYISKDGSPMPMGWVSPSPKPDQAV